MRRNEQRLDAPLTGNKQSFVQGFFVERQVPARSEAMCCSWFGSEPASACSLEAHISPSSQRSDAGPQCIRIVFSVNARKHSQYRHRASQPEPRSRGSLASVGPRFEGLGRSERHQLVVYCDRDVWSRCTSGKAVIAAASRRQFWLSRYPACCGQCTSTSHDQQVFCGRGRP